MNLLTKSVGHIVLKSPWVRDLGIYDECSKALPIGFPVFIQVPSINYMVLYTIDPMSKNDWFTFFIQFLLVLLKKR